MDVIVAAITLVVEAKRRASLEPCLFLRTSIVQSGQCQSLQNAISERLGSEFDVDVCPSYDENAVLRRNVIPERLRIFMVLWDEANERHALNAASLAAASAEIRTRDVSSSNIEFGGERRVCEVVRELAPSEAEGEFGVYLWRLWCGSLRALVSDGAIELRDYLDYVERLAESKPGSLQDCLGSWGATLTVLGGFRFDEWIQFLKFDLDGKTLTKKQRAALPSLIASEHRTMFVSAKQSEVLELMIDGRLGFPESKSDAEELTKSKLRSYLSTGDKAVLDELPWAVDVTAQAFGLRYSLGAEAKKGKAEDSALRATISLLNFIDQSIVESEFLSKMSNSEYQSWIHQLLDWARSDSFGRKAVEELLESNSIELGPRASTDLDGFVGRPDRISLSRELVSFWRPKATRNAPLRCTRLLEGLVEVLVSRDLAEDATALTLRTDIAGAHILSDFSDKDSSAEIASKLRDFATRLKQKVEEFAQLDEDDAEDEPARVVKVAVLKKRTLLRELLFDPGQLGWGDIASDGVPSFQDGGSRRRSLALPQQMVDAWASFSADAIASLGAPLGPSATRWVDDWYSLVAAAARPSKQDQIKSLLEEMQREGADGGGIAKRMMEVNADDSSPGLDASVAASLAQLCSSADVQTLRLLRSHPLVVELRLAREYFLLEGVRQWMGGGALSGREWFDEFVDWVRSGLGEDDFPTPTATYCVGPDRVLAFSEWSRAGEAEFCKPGAGAGSFFGLKQARDFLRDFQRNSSLSGLSRGVGCDRIRVNFGGPRGGMWGLTALQETISQASREDCRFSVTAGLSFAEAGGLFDPTMNGLPDLAEAMRGGETSGSDVEVGAEVLDDSHLLIERGDCVGIQFVTLANLSQVPTPVAVRTEQNMFEHLLFPVNAASLNASECIVEFHRPVHAREFALADFLGRVSGWQPMHLNFRFHPDLVRGPVEKLHRLGRWTYLVSPFRAHLAIAAVAGSDDGSIALVDAWSSQAASGQVFECLSTVVQRDAFKIIPGSELLDDDKFMGLLSVAKVIAPRAARRLISNHPNQSDSADLVGLAGLCLTYQHLSEANPDRVYLSLDQHRDLLRVKRGQRADLLEVRVDAGIVKLRVIESKASASRSFDAVGFVKDGRGQVIETVKKLRHLGREHFMSARFRQRIDLALTDFEFVSEDGEKVRRVVNKLRAECNVEILDSGDGEVHVWCLLDETVAGFTDTGEGESTSKQPSACVHGSAYGSDVLGRLGKRSV